MAIALFLLAVILFFLWFLSLIKPSLVLPASSATRLKGFLFYFLGAFAVLVVAVMLNSEDQDKKWENPETTEVLHLSRHEWTELPEKLASFKKLRRLNLSKGPLESLDQEILTSLTNLEYLNLSENPLQDIPDWVAELPIQKLILDDTQIDTLSPAFANMEVSFENTPWAEKLKAKQAIVEEENDGEPKGESFTDFAIRKVLGNDYGYKKRFKKGELYYTKSITDEQIDALGEFLTTQGYFNDERTISMQITYNDRDTVNAYELRAISNLDSEPEKDVIALFKFQAAMISTQIFDGKPVHFHLTDDEFNTLYIYKSFSEE